jgi:hypothetical protein
MSPIATLRRCAIACAAAITLLLAGDLRAEPLDSPEASEPEAEEPIDFSVLAPAPVPGAAAADASKFTTRLPSSGWNAKLGVDRRPVAALAPPLPPEWQLGSPTDQSGGVAWANVTAPGLPLAWDKAAIETRVDPQDQGVLGMSLSRSLPVSDEVAVTLQNGYALTQTLGGSTLPWHAAPGMPGWAHTIGTNHALRLSILPVDTILSFGTSHSGVDDKWLRSLSAEQKLFGGPVSVTGTLSETPAGETSKSIKAGFKRTW